MAKSFDDGKTWQKFAGNPILPSEPEGLEVTGWRDPFVSSWPSMAAALGRDPEDTLFGIISGGIRDVTPTTFLYAIDARDLTKWQYIGPLVNFGLNLRPSRWSGDLGKNWEVTNFVTLKDEIDPSIARDLLVMGTEGCIPSALLQAGDESPCDASTGPSRPIRGQLWMAGSLQTRAASTSSDSGVVQMQYGFGGHLDHGCLYAANSFFDPKTSKHIVWGWITEEDLCDDLRHEQGWSGLLSLPREIRLQTLENVVRAWKSDLKDITSIESEIDARGTSTVRTLASQPVQSVIDQLRQKASIRRARLSSPLLQQYSHDLAFTSNDIRTTAWELDCSFKVSKRCSNIGIQLVHSRGKSQETPPFLSQKQTSRPELTPPPTDFSHTTTLAFTPSTETFTIARPSFHNSTLVNSKPETAPHTLFTTLSPDKTGAGEETTEPLRIRAWRDNSVLEVFVNERTAISTRLYAAEETVGIRFFAEDGAATSSVASASAKPSSQLLGATLWDGIAV